MLQFMRNLVVCKIETWNNWSTEDMGYYSGLHWD